MFSNVSNREGQNQIPLSHCKYQNFKGEKENDTTKIQNYPSASEMLL